MDPLTQPEGVIPLRANDKPVLFISHRHEDRPIADALRRLIETWTGGDIDVFQSSSPDAGGPRQGRTISEELRRALWRTSVLVLIYTTRDQDWSYCMWECGVAQLPEPSDTKTIVFQCADQFPSVFEGQLRVGVGREDDIERFVTALLTDPSYFPALGRAVWRHGAGTEPVKNAARELYTKLQEVLPKHDPVAQEWPPYPQLTLELTDDQIERIRTAPGSATERLEVTKQLIVNESMVIGGDGQIGRIFSNRDFPLFPPAPPKQLGELISGWEGSTPTPGSRWIEGMCTQIMAAARNQFPTLRWELMRGADPMDETWYAPMLRYIKKVPRRSVTEVDVVFCKFQLDDQGHAKIAVPELVEEF